MINDDMIVDDGKEEIARLRDCAPEMTTPALTPWALACDALADNGCDCSTSGPSMCLACRCYAAMKAERVRAEEAEETRSDALRDLRGAWERTARMMYLVEHLSHVWNVPPGFEAELRAALADGRSEPDDRQERIDSALQVLDGVLCLMVEGPDAAPGRWQGPARQDVERAIRILKGEAR